MSTSEIPTHTYTCPVCPLCGQRATVELTSSEKAGIEDWKSGTIIQIALPDTSENLRELIKSGIHPECWDEMFGEDD